MHLTEDADALTVDGDACAATGVVGRIILDGGVNSEENPDTYTYFRGFELADPTKENAEFLGWYTTADFSGEAITEIVDGTTGDITLYAKWKKTGGCNASVVGISGAMTLLGACAVVLVKKGRKE